MTTSKNITLKFNGLLTEGKDNYILNESSNQSQTVIADAVDNALTDFKNKSVEITITIEVKII